MSTFTSLGSSDHFRKKLILLITKGVIQIFNDGPNLLLLEISASLEDFCLFYFFHFGGAKNLTRKKY